MADDPFLAGMRGETSSPLYSSSDHAAWQQGQMAGGHNAPIMTDATTGEMIAGIIFTVGVLTAMVLFMSYEAEITGSIGATRDSGALTRGMGMVRYLFSVATVCAIGVAIAVAGSLLTSVALAKGRLRQIDRRSLKRVAIAAGASVLWVIALLAYVTMSGQFVSSFVRGTVAILGSVAVVALVHLAALWGTMPVRRSMVAGGLNLLCFVAILGAFVGPRIWAQI